MGGFQCTLSLLFSAKCNMESGIKQQETTIVQQGRRYSFDHQLQQNLQICEHSLNNAKSSPIEVSKSLNNLNLTNGPIKENTLGQFKTSNERQVEFKTNMENLNGVVDENETQHNTTMNNRDTNKRLDSKDPQGHKSCKTKIDLADHVIQDSNSDEGFRENQIMQETKHYETGFRIDHFAECLAEDVLEDSLLEAKAEIETKDTKDISVGISLESTIKTQNNSSINTDDIVNNVNKNDANELLTINTPSNQSDLTVKNLGSSTRRKSDARVYSKSLCLNESNPTRGTCSQNVISSQSQSNLSYQMIDEKPSDLENLIQMYPNEVIIPFDQEDECCSNSVVEGLDKLLSDDDIEEDVENLNKTINNNVSCDETLINSPEESTHIPERSPVQEYNLFNVESVETQILSSNLEQTNSVINNCSNFNGPHMLNYQTSDTQERTENNCDISNNVIATCEDIKVQVPNPTMSLYNDMGDMSSFSHLVSSSMQNINRGSRSQMQIEELQALSNISIVLQGFPDQVEEQLVSGYNDDSEVSI